MPMISEKDLIILSHLRNNARRKVTEISKEMKIPVTTIYDKIKSHEKKGFVNKHVSLLNFSKLGYKVNVLLALQVSRGKLDNLKNYLLQHPNVNSLFRVDFGLDFLAEVVFQNPDKFQHFLDHIDKEFCLDDTRTFNISQELKRETFLSEVIGN